MKTIKISRKGVKVTAIAAAFSIGAFLVPSAVSAATAAFQPATCTTTTNSCLDKRVDALEAWAKTHSDPTTTVTVTAPPTSTTTAPPVTTSTTSSTSTTTSSTTTTEPPVTTSTTTPPPTTTTTPPPASAWPDAASTGVPAGTVLTNSGGLTITTPGTVIDAKNITGAIGIKANNVTIKNSRVTGNNSNDWALINIADGVTGTRLERVEINGGGVTHTGIYGTVTAIGLNIWNVENGLAPDSNSVIRDNWIHNLKYNIGDPHYDGIEVDGGGRDNILIEHNYINMDELNSTATVMLDNYFGPLSNVTVNNNKLIGGGWTVYLDARFGRPGYGGTGGPVTNIKYTNNRIDGGYWGYASIDTFAGDTYTWSGNVDDSSGAVIPTP